MKSLKIKHVHVVCTCVYVCAYIYSASASASFLKSKIYVCVYTTGIPSTVYHGHEVNFILYMYVQRDFNVYHGHAMYPNV